MRTTYLKTLPAPIVEMIDPVLATWDLRSNDWYVVLN
jgi:hypothetical protein